jgi:nicotinamidase-related amidase
MKALIVIDFVNEYKDDIYADKKVIPNTLRLISHFKKKKWPVIAAIPYPSKLGDNPVMIHLWGEEIKDDKNLDKTKIRVNKGNRKRDLIPELLDVKWDKIVKKTEYSAFYKTSLETYCKQKNIDELYFAGIYSGVCVHYSGVDAAMRRIMPVLVTDASTTENKEWHKENCKQWKIKIGKITTSKKLLD